MWNWNERCQDLAGFLPRAKQGSKRMLVSLYVANEMLARTLGQACWGETRCLASCLRRTWFDLHSARRKESDKFTATFTCPTRADWLGTSLAFPFADATVIMDSSSQLINKTANSFPLYRYLIIQITELKTGNFQRFQAGVYLLSSLGLNSSRDAPRCLSQSNLHLLGCKNAPRSLRFSIFCLLDMAWGCCLLPGHTRTS